MLEIIQKELQEFKDKITILDTWKFNQKETIERCMLYYNSRFVSGEYDDKGFKKYFYNIVRSACGTTTKAIDLDTKDINLLNADGGNPWKLWFYQRDLKYWMKKKEFGKRLNDISDELPKYGTVVLKVVGGEISIVDLRTFICEQNADTLDLSNYIIEQHYYTKTEFRKIAKEKGWENAEKIIKAYDKGKSQYIRVFERYGEVKDEETGLSDYKMVLVADIPRDLKTSNESRFEIGNGGIILASELRDRHPYIEIHTDKIRGRWLGVGVIETLFDPQTRLNELTNQEVISSYFASLNLWQTRDIGAVRNLLTDTDGGDVLNLDDDLKKIDVADRNLSHYISERQKWEENARQQTFSYDVIRGERPPAGTPLGSAQLSFAMTMSFFDHMRENIALGLKSMLYNYVFPEFKKSCNKEHMIRIAGKDLSKLNKMIVETNAHSKFFEYIKEKGRLPSQDFINLIKGVEEERIKNNKEVMLEIPEGFYEDVEYDVDIVIVGEGKDTRVIAQTLYAALQAITVDPTLMTDPMKKKVFGEWLEQGGVSLIDLEAEIYQEPEASPMVEARGAGGGVGAMADMAGQLEPNVIGGEQVI